MKPYNVEIFTPAFELVDNTNVSEVDYKEDYLSADENSVTVLALPGVQKQDYIRISRGTEEYARVITEISYGTEKSKQLQMISYKPLVELLNTQILFDTDLQGSGTIEEFICNRIRETFMENSDALQNIIGLTLSTSSGTEGWDLHITPSESGGHYNIVNLMDSVVIPALQKYGIVIKVRLDVQQRQLHMIVGRTATGVIVIESDLPNVIQKSVTIKQVSADVNKLVLYNGQDYTQTRTYYLHSDLSYDTRDTDRVTSVICELQVVGGEEENFESAAISAAHNKFSSLAYSNLIELTMSNEDELLKPETLEFGQEVDVVSDGKTYRSILTGRERSGTTKLIFGTVRLDLTKILRRE